MEIVNVTYRVCAHNDVFVCHHFSNGYVMETFLKSFSDEDSAFEFIYSILKEC